MKNRYLRVLLCSALTLALAAPTTAAAAGPVLPRPSYSNTVHLYVYTPSVQGTEAAFRTDTAKIQRRFAGGPYARVGVAGFWLVDLDWRADPRQPVLRSPSATELESLLKRAKDRGLAVHVGLTFGTTRQSHIYAAAAEEDRRNAQWFQDGAIAKEGDLAKGQVWMTLSRYARKLRRHLETKVRLAARLFATLRRSYPDTLVSVSGDGEVELNNAGLDILAAYEAQGMCDYSPFAIQEFRDWIQNSGLYAAGQPFAGQGWKRGGPIYQGDSGLAAFNRDHGTSFRSWNLRAFPWSLSDPVDGDPRALQAERATGPGFVPMPTSGSDFVEGGFDAPRKWDLPSPQYWKLWLTFRQAMVANYVSDVATWVTTSRSRDGAAIDPDRWYTHQIPADYLYGVCPQPASCPALDRRLLTSASPLSTAFTGGSVAMGLTVFDVYSAGRYLRTSQYLYDDVVKMGRPHWGIVEFNPMWSAPVGGPVDPDVDSVKRQIKRAYDAGAHILGYLFEEPFASFEKLPAAEAFGRFLSDVKFQPRDAGRVAYAPPEVTGLRGSTSGKSIVVEWNTTVFRGLPAFRYSDWASFERFEVYRGATPGFGRGNADLVVTTREAAARGIIPDPARPFYKVAAVAKDGQQGPLSLAWEARGR
jgi:hypothetical protein